MLVKLAPGVDFIKLFFAGARCLVKNSPFNFSNILPLTKFAKFMTKYLSNLWAIHQKRRRIFRVKILVKLTHGLHLFIQLLPTRHYKRDRP
jgi:hypothetical protein